MCAPKMTMDDPKQLDLDKHAFMQVNGAMSNSGVRQECTYAGKWNHVQLGSLSNSGVRHACILQ